MSTRNIRGLQGYIGIFEAEDHESTREQGYVKSESGGYGLIKPIDASDAGSLNLLSVGFNCDELYEIKSLSNIIASRINNPNHMGFNRKTNCSNRFKNRISKSRSVHAGRSR